MMCFSGDARSRVVFRHELRHYSSGFGYDNKGISVGEIAGWRDVYREDVLMATFQQVSPADGWEFRTGY